MSNNVLVLDPGSSSFKFGVYEWTDQLECKATGQIDRVKSPNAELELEIRGQPTHRSTFNALTPTLAAEAIIQKIGAGFAIDAVGCRVVHGGDTFTSAVLVTTAVINSIRELSPLAPLHNPVSADVLETCFNLLPNVPAIAVFDTTFHRTMPEVATTYALPRELCAEHHLRRFGFHGIAHGFVSAKLIDLIDKFGQPSRCVTCHLGNGASICAVKDGMSIDTSMGMTPMEGLVMGTRSGDVDPGLLMYLLRTVGMPTHVLDELLCHQSGLLGISGTNSDVRDLEKSASAGDIWAELAMEVFAYRAAKTIGGYAVALGGLDAIAFSGGIGEHSAKMRERICRRLSVLGVCLETELNEADSVVQPRNIHKAGTTVSVWIIPADENWQIAKETRDWFAAYGAAATVVSPGTQ